MDSLLRRLIDYESTENENTDGSGGNSATDSAITSDELRTIVGEEIDDKLKGLGLHEKLSKLDLLDDLEGLFERHKTSPVDQKSLVGEINKVIDNKLAELRGSGNGSGDGNGGSAKRTGGPLSRWLGI